MPPLFAGKRKTVTEEIPPRRPSLQWWNITSHGHSDEPDDVVGAAVEGGAVPVSASSGGVRRRRKYTGYVRTGSYTGARANTAPSPMFPVRRIADCYVLAVHNYTGVDVVRQGGVTKYVIGFGWSKNWRTFRPSSRSWSGVPLLDPQEVVKAIGKTQPFRPVISLSVPLAELKDLPKLIRQIELHHLTNLRNHGIDPKKVAAGDFLAWKFGVAPLLKDISTLFELGKKVDARLKLLEESLSRGYYGANVSLSSTDLYLPEYVSSLTRPAYFGGGPKVTWHFAGKRRRWAYVRWVPLTGAREKIRQALRVWAKFEDKTLFNVFAAGAASKDPYSLFYKFLGISNAQAVASVWELSPWSWLVDWLIPLGDLLQSSIAGNIPWQSSHGCIMEEDTFRFVIDSIDVAKPSHGSLQQQLTAKVDGPVPVRFVRRVVPDILDNTQLRSDLPVLDKNQMAILLALVLQRLP